MTTKSIDGLLSLAMFLPTLLARALAVKLTWSVLMVPAGLPERWWVAVIGGNLIWGAFRANDRKKEEQTYVEWEGIQRHCDSVIVSGFLLLFAWTVAKVLL